jgi:steroid delta-isomerase-like uncharacterized protein
LQYWKIAVSIVLLGGFVCQPSVAANAPIGKSDIARWSEAWNSHNINKVADLFSPDVIIYQPSNPKPLDAAGLHAFFSMIFRAYPDFKITVTDSLIDGMKAATFERVTGTWSGPYTDPATGVAAAGNGRTFDHPGVMYIVYRPDHKISEVRIYWDRLTVDQQLGIDPDSQNKKH